MPAPDRSLQSPADALPIVNPSKPTPGGTPECSAKVGNRPEAGQLDCAGIRFWLTELPRLHETALMVQWREEVRPLPSSLVKTKPIRPLLYPAQP